VHSIAKCVSVGFADGYPTEPIHAPLLPAADPRGTSRLFRLLTAKVPIERIAEELGHHRSTIHREIRRNLFREVKKYRGCYPITADDRARQRRQRRRKLIRDAQLQQHVTRMLARWWSPEQIAGRLRLAGTEARLCHETIYQFVYTRKVVGLGSIVTCCGPGRCADAASAASLAA
jgi:IS30 family transposase